MIAHLTLPGRRRQSGAGMVETMVGILIGLLVVLVVYNMLAVAEGYKRSTTGVADAQITGLLSQMLTGRDLANSGNGISASAADLINCTRNDANTLDDTTLRPIPLVVTDGGAGVSDSFISWQSASPHVVWPVDIRPNAGVPDVPAGGDIVVQSPNGFSKPDGTPLPTPGAGGIPYWVVAIANNGTGRCRLLQVENATAPDAVTGEVLLTQGTIKTVGVYTGVPANSAGTGARLLNLGPRGDSSRLLYDVDANAQLRTTDCLNRDWACAGGTPNPIAQNIVLMKVQYGIDTSNPLDGVVDCWTPADASTCGDWSAGTVQGVGFTQLQIDRMIAARIAIVVRSDEPDLKDATLVAATRAPVVLFNCAANTDIGCPNRITLGAGPTVSFGSATCAPAVPPNVICDNWRYRTYETIVPLRNAIYLATVPGGP